MKLTTKKESDWDTNIPLWERSKDHLIGEIRGHPLLPVENVNDVLINSFLAIFLSIQSAVVWSENNLNWTKTSTTLTDSDIGFFPSPTYKHSLYDEDAVSQSDISWWLNKLFDFWIILRLTEFEMWAACNVLLAQKRWALLLTEKTCKRYFLSLFSCAELLFSSAYRSCLDRCFEARFKSAIYNLLSRFLWTAAQYGVTLLPGRTDILLAAIKEHCPLY